MENPPKHDFSHGLHHLETPLLDNLTVAEDSYSTLSAKQVFYAMRGRLRNNKDMKQILTLVGGPRAGKTSFLGEMAENLVRGGHHGAVITYDSALIAAKALGLVDPRHKSGQYTPEEFHRTSQLMEKAISLALEDDTLRFVLVETVGTTGLEVRDANGQLIRLGSDRGASTLQHIARHGGALQRAFYEDCYIYMVVGRDRREKGHKVRLKLDNPSNNPTEVLGAHGVLFHGGASERPLGGSAEGTFKVDIEEKLISDQLIALQYIKPTHEMDSLSILQGKKDRNLPLKFLTKRFAPWYFGQYLGVNRIRVANVINNEDLKTHVYHDTLKKLDYIQNMMKEGKGRKLLPS